MQRHQIHNTFHYLVSQIHNTFYAGKDNERVRYRKSEKEKWDGERKEIEIRKNDKEFVMSVVEIMVLGL